MTKRDKAYAWLVTILVLAVLFLSIISTRKQTEPPSSTQGKESKVEHPKQVAGTPNDRGVKGDFPQSNANSQTVQIGPLKIFRFHGEADGTSALSVVENPNPFIERAKAGDGASALLVLSAINVCFPLSDRNLINPVAREKGQPVAAWAECNSLNPELGVNRLEILMPAIKAGSSEAKFAYAISARDIFLNDRYAGDMQSLYTTDQVNRVVEQYAIDAVNAGIEEAFAFLAKSYLRGEFGLRDATEAAAYAAALDSVKPNGLGAYLFGEYSKSLDPQQRASAMERAASIAAACCRK